MNFGRNQTMLLPKSLAALGTDKFQATLEVELGVIADQLPIERMCAEGGWPDEDSLEIEISDVRVSKGKTYVTIKCQFSEVVPTGCADIQMTESGFGELELIFDPLQSSVYIESEDDY